VVAIETGRACEAGGRGRVRLVRARRTFGGSEGPVEAVIPRRACSSRRIRRRRPRRANEATIASVGGLGLPRSGAILALSTRLAVTWGSKANGREGADGARLSKALSTYTIITC